MCHNSSIESEQIDRFVAYGMPQKVIKSVKYTIRKRHKADNEKRRRREKEEEAVIIAAAAAAAPIATVTEMITETANINDKNELTTATETATATKNDNTTIISANTTNITITQTTVNDSANGLYEALTSSSSSLSSSLSLSSLSSGQNTSKSNSSKVDVVKETTTVGAVTETNEEPTKGGTELKLEKKLLTIENHNETNKSEEIISKAINMQNYKQQQEENQPTNTNNSKKTFKLLQSIPKFCGRYRPLLQQLQREQAEEAEQKLMTFSKVCDDEPAATATTTTEPATTGTTAQLNAQRRSISVMDPKTLEPSMDDALAIGTQMTRKFAERLASAVGKLQCSKLYTILTRTTQPAHLIAICILTFVLLTVGPDLIENHNGGSSDNNGMKQTVAAATTTTINNKAATATETTTSTQSGGRGGSGGLATIAYLAAFATHFGAQIWMTFVSGLSLYFSLPRHTFGQCQQILFPKYFALNAMLSILMLIIYVKYFLINWTFAAILQLTSLALTAIIEVTVRLYLAPPMLRLMHEKYKIEDAIGSGQEVGSLVQGDLVQCPHYQRIHKGFRRIHMTIAIGNMLVMLATFLHLYFLASKIRIS